MALTEDQHPAGDLGPRGEQEPFRIGIRTRASGWDDHGFGARAGKAHPGQQSVNVLVTGSHGRCPCPSAISPARPGERTDI